MKTSNIITGMQIIQRYYDDADGCDVVSINDAIYMRATDRPIEPGDLKRLVWLGWMQEDDAGRKFESCDYDINERWCCYL